MELQVHTNIPEENIEENSVKKTKFYTQNLNLHKKFQYAHLESKPTGKLTKNDKALEILKCKYNIVYFLKNYVMIPLSGGGATPLLVNEYLMTVALLYQASFPFIFQTSRQSSKTTIILACCLWYSNFWSNTKVMFFNTKTKENKKNLRDLKKMYSFLPTWLNSYKSTDPNNVETFVNSIKSEINLCVVDKDSPDATGRGNTGGIYLDEFGFLKNIHIAYAPLSFIYSNYSAMSRKNYVPAPYAITSTPADPMEPEGEFFFDLWNKAVDIEYDEISHMLPHEIYEYMDSKCNGFRLAKVYQVWYQFPGRCDSKLFDKDNEDNIIHLLDDPFVDLELLEEHSKEAVEYLKTVRSICRTKSQLRREVYCEFLSVLGDSIFDEDFIESIPKANPVKQYTLPDTKSGKLNVYVENDINKIENTNYIISIDPAYTTKGDFAGIVVYNWDSGEIEATAKLQLGKIKLLPKVIKYIASIYVNGPIIIERNNFGISVIEDLLEDHQISNRLFYSYGNKNLNRIADSQKINSRVYGIQTDRSSRPKMVDAFIKFVNEHPDKLKSSELIKELYYLQENKDRIEAKAGYHDDMIMSFSFILYLLTYKEKELRKFKILSSSSKAMLMKLNQEAFFQTEENELTKKLLKDKNIDYSAKASDPTTFNLQEFKKDKMDNSFSKIMDWCYK